MKPRITVITIGVDDLEKSLTFYRDGLGFATEGIVGKEFEHGAVVFIPLQPSLRLALWPRKSIVHDTGLTLSPPSANEMTLGHNVSSNAEVDASWHRHRQRVRSLSSQRTILFGVGIPVISKTQTVISGK